jgi:predicted lipid carrier protein YhbT
LDGSGLEVPRLTAEYFARLLGYAREAQWGRARRTSPPSRLAAPRSPVRDYFERFLPEKIGRNLLPNLRKLTARFGIALREDPQSQWVLDVRDGVLNSVAHAVPRDATDCRYTVDAPTLLEIVAGRLSPQVAFFQRRVEIGGDMATGLKTAVILAQFFRQYPFTFSAAKA